MWQVPCIRGSGSCNYTNPCQYLNKVKCPTSVVEQGWKCRCPIPVGTFTYGPITTFIGVSDSHFCFSTHFSFGKNFVRFVRASLPIFPSVLARNWLIKSIQIGQYSQNFVTLYRHFVFEYLIKADGLGKIWVNSSFSTK